MSGLSVGGCARALHGIFTLPRRNPQHYLTVVKAGTVCRTVIWPCLVPVALYQYMRAKDEDYYALELLHARSKSEDVKAFYDQSKPGLQGHWRIQDDMELIRKRANP